jgi:hypothetical protein
MTRIRCYTLFDIKYTGVFNRKAPLEYDVEQIAEWNKTRNQQVNLDTILQIISLRGQPENISEVTNIDIDFASFKNFGFLYQNEEPQKCSVFDFSVNHKSVFNNGSDDLGYLYEDCDEVPMLKIGSEWEKLPNFLDTSPELKNIYFEVIEDG